MDKQSYLDALVQYRLGPKDYFRELTPKKQIYIHHTASLQSPGEVIKAWHAKGFRMATAFLIAGKPQGDDASYYEADIFQAFASKFWANHLGISARWNQIEASYKTPDKAKALEKQSVAIELCAAGHLTYQNGKFYTAAKVEIPEAEVQVYDTPFRGVKYFHKYSEAQIAALRQTLLYLGDKFSIPLDYSDAIWEIDSKALTGQAGLYAHTSVRTDVADCHPQPELVAMLRSLAGAEPFTAEPLPAYKREEEPIVLPVKEDEGRPENNKDPEPEDFFKGFKSKDEPQPEDPFRDMEPKDEPQAEDPFQGLTPKDEPQPEDPFRDMEPKDDFSFETSDPETPSDPVYENPPANDPEMPAVGDSLAEDGNMPHAEMEEMLKPEDPHDIHALFDGLGGKEDDGGEQEMLPEDALTETGLPDEELPQPEKNNVPEEVLAETGLPGNELPKHNPTETIEAPIEEKPANIPSPKIETYGDDVILSGLGGQKTLAKDGGKPAPNAPDNVLNVAESLPFDIELLMDGLSEDDKLPNDQPTPAAKPTASGIDEISAAFKDMGKRSGEASNFLDAFLKDLEDNK